MYYNVQLNQNKIMTKTSMSGWIQVYDEHEHNA